MRLSEATDAVPAETPRSRVLGVAVDPLTLAQTADAIARHIALGRAGAHLGVNAANLVAAHDDPNLAADLARAELVGADGQSVVWAARFLGCPVPERVTGIDLMQRLLRDAPGRGWRVYFLGAPADVVATVAARARRAGVDVAGAHHGFFSEDQDPDIAAMVAAADPDLVFIGMPSPRKERFMMVHARVAGIPFCVGVGGSFDVIAGQKRRAPRWLQRAGLEWTVRLAQEPRRLARRYTVTNVRFLRLLVAELLRSRRTDAGT